MSKFNKLSRAEMRNVLGGTYPVGGDGNCSKDCTCSDGSHVSAKITSCDTGTCDVESDGVNCKVAGKDTFATCTNACPPS